MDSSEEAYNKYIIVDDAERSDESEKENAAPKQTKTSRKQFDLIIATTKDFNEQTYTKEILDQRWNLLAAELNNIGPPIRDAIEWRRVWSVYKYNQKRKQPGTESGKRVSTKQMLAGPFSGGQSQSSNPLSDELSSQVFEKLVISQTEKVMEKLDQIWNEKRCQPGTESGKRLSTKQMLAGPFSEGQSQSSNPLSDELSSQVFEKLVISQTEKVMEKLDQILNVVVESNQILKTVLTNRNNI